MFLAWIPAIGYAIFYWGVHHFPGWDCPTPNGCRYPLLELLGVPKSWGFTKYASVGLTSGQHAQAGDQGIGPNDNPSENSTTPNGLTGGNGWVNNILDGIGAPKSFNNQNKLTAWNNCEGNVAGHSGLGINNPFNVTADSYQPATHGTNAVNSDGVQSFATMSAGIQGNVAKLNEPFAGAIKSNLVNDGTFQAFANAVGSSGWGTNGSCIAKNGA